MQTKSRSRGIWTAGLALCGIAASASADPIDLFEWAINGDGAIYKTSGSTPPFVDTSAFDFNTGLGSMTASFTGPGTRYFSLYVDHEIDETVNTYFNEFGQAVNTPKAGQTWEIDEPGFSLPPGYVGNIYDHFLAGTLDNANGVPSTAVDDVAMALAWSFSLGTDETATIKMLLSNSVPPTDFYLVQTDPDSSTSVYFSSTISFAAPTVVPDCGATATLLALSLLGLKSLPRKRLTVG